MRRITTLLTFLTISLLPVLAQQDVITTAVGGGPNKIPAVGANLNQPDALAFDSAGNYYVSAYAANRVYKVDTSGRLTILAGYGIAGYTGDNVVGGASSGQLNGPTAVAVDSAGNVYISDYNNCVVRKVDNTGTLTTFAGTGTCGFGGDNGPAASAKLYLPRSLAIDVSGNLYIADHQNCRVRKVVLGTGIISTVAGTGTCTYSGDGGAATSAGIALPTAVAVDNAGDLFIGDLNSYRIREVTISDGNINTVAGTGANGYTGDGAAATSAKIGQTFAGVAVNSAGTTVTLTDYTHSVVRQFGVNGIPNTGVINTIAGTGTAGYSGDGGPADAAKLSGPQGVALSSTGTVYIGDNANNRVRAFAVSGIPNTATINTVAGNGNITFPTLVSGLPASGVVLNDPTYVMQDPSGNLFIVEYTNCMVRELVKSTGLVNIFAGSAASLAVAGSCGFSGEGGPATSAQLGNVEDVARDSSGNIYISDFSNCVVWEVAAATGNISLFAGVTPKSCGFAGDGGLATSAKLNGPAGLAVDRANNVYISDYTGNRVRKVSGGVITTIAGIGTAGYIGDGDPAIIAELRNPYGLAVDSAGNLFIADYDNCVIREVTASTGIINTVAGTGACGFNGDGKAIDQELNHPARVHLDPNENLFISDNNNERVRWISPSGTLTTIAGNGSLGITGDGGPALNAEFNAPNGIAQDGSGNYLIADYTNLRIRQVSAFAALNASDTSLDFGLVTDGAMSTPQVLTLSAMGPVTLSNIAISGPFVEYDDCGTALANAATCVMYVFFKPTGAGVESGSITIEDNGFFSNTTTINLSGIGSAVAVTSGPLQFGNVAVKSSSAAQRVTVTNKGAASITMGAITLNETDFVIASTTCPASGSPLAGGASCAVNIVFRPKTTGPKRGALIITDSDPSSPQIVGMTGNGTSLVVFNPSSVTFAAQAVGTTSALTKVVLTNNTGATLTLKSPAVTITGPFSTVGATTCTNNLPIAAGGTCTIYLQFTPTAVGFPSGTLSVSDSDTTSPQTVALSGTGTGVEFTPTTVSLSSTVGHQVSTSVTITNVGTSTISFTAWTITGPNAPDFTANLADPPCAGSLAAGAVCTFTAFFKPSITGAESASLVLYDSSTGSPQSLLLSGTGQ